MIHIKQYIFNPFQVNCFVAWDNDGNCAIIDPGYIDAERARLVAFIEENKLKPSCILLTHGHFDHCYGLADLAQRYSIPIYMDSSETYSFENTNPYVCGAYDLPLPTIPSKEHFKSIKDGDKIQVGTLSFEALQTPGHSVGGVCYLEKEEKALFSGDTLFAGAIGRTDHPGGDYDQLMNSIFTKLMVLDGDITVYPGHGPQTDISTERMTNPFLMPFNEPYEE